MTPDDFARNDEVGAPPLPRLLCPEHHQPVYVDALRHRDHDPDHVSHNLQTISRACPTCIRVNPPKGPQ